MAGYTLRVRKITSEKKTQLEGMLPHYDTASAEPSLDQTLYTFSPDTSERQVLKITKIITTLNIPYWQLTKSQ